MAKVYPVYHGNEEIGVVSPESDLVIDEKKGSVTRLVGNKVSGWIFEATFSWQRLDLNGKKAIVGFEAIEL